MFTNVSIATNSNFNSCFLRHVEGTMTLFYVACVCPEGSGAIAIFISRYLFVTSVNLVVLSGSTCSVYYMSQRNRRHLH